MKSEITITQKHSTVLVVMSLACFGTIAESVVQGWETWVPPIIFLGILAAWMMHIAQSHTQAYRENYYFLFTMLITFFHGVHKTSFFDVVVASTIFMVLLTYLRRQDFLLYALIEFIVVFAMHIIWSYRTSYINFDTLDVSRILFHFLAEICVYRVLKEVIKESMQAEEEIAKRDDMKEADRVAMEDFLVNISHELRTPVNVISGISAMILRKENRDDIRSIRDAGRRLSRQIENIQDYSEIQRGNVSVENEPYQITDLWKDFLETYATYNQKGMPELSIDLDPLLPTVLCGDVKKLQKIIRHLLDNAYKFTAKGGVNVKISGIKKDYGMNLIIEVSDTGCGMSAADKENVSKGFYQADAKRNRATGGIGLGLSVVYGFTRAMDGFVSIDSEKDHGTSIRISVAQEVVDASPCLSLDAEEEIRIAFYMNPGKFKVTKLREFYTDTATNLAKGLGVNLFSVSALSELKTTLKEENISYVFMGEEEYLAAPAYFDELAKSDVKVAVSASKGFSVSKGSGVIVMPKPLYAAPILEVINGEAIDSKYDGQARNERISYNHVKALLVDDEPMNLVVAGELFKEYHMEVETASSGKEAIEKCKQKDYDVVFMDYMMPEMDGIEAMKRIRFVCDEKRKKIFAVAISANAISGARELFLNNGFDGYIPKPIQISEFERIMARLVSQGLHVDKEVM